MSQDAIILFSHGSLLCGSGEALKGHARRLQAQGLAPIVEVGYLNYSEPPFAEAVEKCVAAGATRLLITPYFLIPGKFVKVDLPQAVAQEQAAHPNIEFVVAQAIGYDDALADALIESAKTAAPPDTWRDDLKRAPQFCRPAPLCPLYDTLDCPKHPGTKTLSREV